MNLTENHPMFQRVGAASGPGVHTDEASSALPDLRDDLSAQEYGTLERASRGDVPRPNPAADLNARKAIVTMRQLFPLGRLITGLWGPDPAHKIRELDLEGQPLEARRRLRVLQAANVRENPYEPRLEEPFFVRMKLLAVELEALRRHVAQRYEEKRAPENKRDWLAAVETMRRAVQWVIRQEHAAAPTIVGTAGVFDMPFVGGAGKGWEPVAKGNAKLSFVAYSEYPMATCPGAGACAVPFDKFERQRADKAACLAEVADKSLPLERRRWPKAKTKSDCQVSVGGWCYSFKAFRYPFAFARLFLNTLANYADREFAIIAGGGRGLPEAAYAARVRAALAGLGARVWPRIVAVLVRDLTRLQRGVPKPRQRKKPRPGKVAFMRLFVDGDINTEDNIVAWMQAVGELGPGGALIEAGRPHVEVYGYSKCWQQFVNADRLLRQAWPSNYTVNLSSGSIYSHSASAMAVRTAMEMLPISRGYFEAIPLQAYLPQLRVQTELLRKNPDAPLPVVTRDLTADAFRFDETRVRQFLRINGIRSLDEAMALLPGAPWPRDKQGRTRPMPLEKVRHYAYDYFLGELLRDPEFGALVRREIARDKDNAAEHDYLLKVEARQRDRLRAALQGGPAGAEPYTRKALLDKAAALTLHEVLWSFGLGGSCPLICGNCSDHPGDMLATAIGAPVGANSIEGVHRCASKTTFKNRTIHIGLH